jgi:hypothetical protein
MFRSFGGTALLAGALAGCSPVGNDQVPDPASTLDESVFKCSVEPVVAKYCSYNACHGIAGTALRVYTPGKLRAAPAASIDDLIAPLTDAEHHANFESAAAFGFGLATVDDCFLLRKPLPAEDGGYEHEGGAIYADEKDPSYLAIRAWLAGQGKCP